MSRLASLVVLLSGCSVEPPETTAEVRSAVTTQTTSRQVVTKIRVNGRGAEMFLVDTTTGSAGQLNASLDELTSTSTMDFSYTTPDTDPAYVILVSGAGAIPNSALYVDLRSASLHVTTPFAVTRCRVNLADGTFVCADSTPRRFDLAWTRNGVGRLRENITRFEELGPVTTWSQGEFASVTADVDGTWDGHAMTDGTGKLFDTESVTIIRDITLLRN